MGLEDRPDRRSRSAFDADRARRSAIAPVRRAARASATRARAAIRSSLSGAASYALDWGNFIPTEKKIQSNG